MSKPWDTSGRWLSRLAVLGALAAFASATAAQTFEDPRFSSELVATVDTYGPVGLAWAPDGRTFIWQKNGIVRVLENDGTLVAAPFLDFSDKVNTFDDNGMIGLAVAPDFATSGHIFLTYIHEVGSDPNDSSGTKFGRVVRVTADPANPNRMLAGSEVTIMDGFPSNGGNHTLGSIRFAEDGTMFVGNGDGSQPYSASPEGMAAQNLDSVRGKILRINPDGTAPTNNPFYNGTNSIRSKIWAYGVRNPYRFSLHPHFGLPYFLDVGWYAWDEINIGVRGGNFGWPCYEGTPTQPAYQDQFPACAQVTNVISPIAEFGPATWDVGQPASCALGGDFYTGTQYPAAYHDNYFYADYANGWIHRLLLDEDGHAMGRARFASGIAVPVAVEQGPDGLLYYVSFSTGQIRRIRYDGAKAVASATPTHGYSPLQVTFSSQGSSSPAGPLTYSWDFGDGGSSTQANPTHLYVGTDIETFTARLTVQDPASQTATSSVDITLNSAPPVPTITTPTDETGYMPGQTVVFHGTATDPDEGALAPSALSWRILLYHNTHSHTSGAATGADGSFEIKYHGDIGTFRYELTLTATDASGHAASTAVDLPILSDGSPPTAPSGLTAVSAGYGVIDLSWVGSTDNASVEEYRIERCAGGACTTFLEVATSPTTTHRDAALAGGTTYRYRVRALDGSLNASGYSAVAVATTPPPPPVPGLVAAYSFHEGSGSGVTDLSPYGNNGQISGATWTSAGYFGPALMFDGNDDLVSIPDAPSLDLSTRMTLEAWVYPISVGGWRDVIYKANNAYWLAGSSDPSSAPSTGGAFSDALKAAGPLPLGTWSHLAAAHNGTQLLLYVNGAQVASKPESDLIPITSLPLTIGGDAIYDQFWHGRIDEVRVYNRALTPAEIQTDMITSINLACPDGDEDGRCDSGMPAVDCDDGNAQIWAAPGEVGRTVFVNATTLTWAPPASGGGTAWAYDVLRSNDPASFTIGAVCAETGVSVTTVPVSETPLPAVAHYYLVRARNACPEGAGSLGQGSNGVERAGRSCP